MVDVERTAETRSGHLELIRPLSRYASTAKILLASRFFPKTIAEADPHPAEPIGEQPHRAGSPPRQTTDPIHARLRSLACAATILSGIEMVHMTTKRQARSFNPAPSLVEQFDILTARGSAQLFIHICQTQVCDSAQARRGSLWLEERASFRPAL